MTMTHSPRGSILRRRGWGGLLLALGLVLLAGCAAAPVVRFHSLLPTEPPPPRPAAAQPLPAVRLVVAPVRIPSALDQPQWLVRRADASLQLLEQDRWASPLADELRAALREALGARHGVTDGTLPLTRTAGGPGLPEAPAWRLLVEVLRLEAWPGGYSQLDVQWVLQPPRAGAPAAQCRFMVREPVSGPDTLALADAHRRALQRLADDIGRQLTVMLAGGSAACSGPPTS